MLRRRLLDHRTNRRLAPALELLRIFYRKALPLIDIEVFSGIHVPQFNWTRARVSTNVNAISGVVPASCNDVNGAS
jgi:hypothetical protein